MSYTLDICHMQVINDDTHDIEADIKAFDDVCSNIEIKTVVFRDSWPELSDAIAQCLDKMHPEVKK